MIASPKPVRRKVVKRESFNAFELYVTLACGHDLVVRIGSRYARAATLECGRCTRATDSAGEGQ